jgi:hypothetical protein
VQLAHTSAPWHVNCLLSYLTKKTAWPGEGHRPWRFHATNEANSRRIHS